MGGIFGVLLGIAVMGFILAMVLGVFDQATNKWEQVDTVALLNILRINVQRDFATASSYGFNRDLVADLDSRGSIPDNARRVVNGSTQIHHSMGGQIKVTGGPSGIGTQYRITLASLDDEDCASIGDQFTGQSATRSRLVNVVANGTALAAPVRREQLTANCDAGKGNNSIGFTFR